MSKSARTNMALAALDVLMGLFWLSSFIQSGGTVTLICAVGMFMAGGWIAGITLSIVDDR